MGYGSCKYHDTELFMEDTGKVGNNGFLTGNYEVSLAASEELGVLFSQCPWQKVLHLVQDMLDFGGRGAQGTQTGLTTLLLDESVIKNHE